MKKFSTGLIFILGIAVSFLHLDDTWALGNYYDGLCTTVSCCVHNYSDDLYNQCLCDFDVGGPGYLGGENCLSAGLVNTECHCASCAAGYKLVVVVGFVGYCIPAATCTCSCSNNPNACNRSGSCTCSGSNPNYATCTNSCGTGKTCCGGSCVSNVCGSNCAFKTGTCKCEAACPPGGSDSTGTHVYISSGSC